MTLGDLRKLLLMVEDESNVKYAVLGIQLYQRKGHDFNEELCSHFIRACVRGNKPSAASELIIDFSNRIGAWASATSFHHLVEALLKVEDKSLLIPTFEMVVRKGLKPAANTLVLLEEFISQETDEEMKKKGLAGLDKLKA